MTKDVACPRCTKTSLLRVVVIALEREVILCPDCQAVWLHHAAIGPRSWIAYETFMLQAGRLAPHDPHELRRLGPLMR